METLGRMTAIIIAVILLILFPIRYDAKKTEISMESYISTEMDMFLNHMQNRSAITRQMYMDFLDDLAVTGESFQVTIDRYTKSYYFGDREKQGMEYEDVIVYLSNYETMEFDDSDYIVLTISRQSDSFLGQIKNLFLPTFSEKRVFQTGGGIR